MAQFGSAPALGAGGPRFESGHPDHHFACLRPVGDFAEAGAWSGRPLYAAGIDPVTIVLGEIPANMTA